jgi:hypothetical protein
MLYQIIAAEAGSCTTASLHTSESGCFSPLWNDTGGTTDGRRRKEKGGKKKGKSERKVNVDAELFC